MKVKELINECNKQKLCSKCNASHQCRKFREMVKTLEPWELPELMEREVDNEIYIRD